jgi:hypothetical protein
VIYGGDDLEAWEKASLQYMPGWMVFDFKMMYEYFQQKGLRATAAEREAAERLIGHPMRAYDPFVKETVAAWTAPPPQLPSDAPANGDA